MIHQFEGIVEADIRIAEIALFLVDNLAVDDQGEGVGKINVVGSVRRNLDTGQVGGHAEFHLGQIQQLDLGENRM